MRLCIFLALLTTFGCRRDKGPEQLEVPSTVSVPADGGIEVVTRRSMAHRDPEGFYTADWAGYLRNTGSGTMRGWSIDVDAFAADGAKLVSDHWDNLGITEYRYVHEGFGVQLGNMGHRGFDKRPARLEVRVSSGERTPRDPKYPAPSPLAVTWDAPLPAGVTFDVTSFWCGGGSVEGIGPSAGRVIFDCQLGVRNTGTVPTRAPTLRVTFQDEAGKEIDSEWANARHDGWPLLPGDAIEYTAARGVLKHARFVLRGTLN